MSSDRILRARLSGTAGRHATLGSETEVAVAELRAITTRPDLLGAEAGICMAQLEVRPEVSPWARRSLELLIAAGADRAAAEVEMAEVVRVLRRRSHATPPG